MPSLPSKFALLLMLAAGTALAQKPAPLGSPGAAEGGKPPALGATPAPLTPAPAPAAPAPDTARRPPAPPPPQAAAPALPPLPPPPADEDPAIRRLRTTFGPDVQMAYRSATVIDSSTGSFRLDGVTLRRPNAEATIDTLTISGQRDNGVDLAEIRNLTMREQGGPRVTLAEGRIAGLAIRGQMTPGQDVSPDAISLDRFSLRGLRVEDAWTVTVASLTLEDYGPGRQTRFRLDDLAGRGTAAGSAGVDAFALARFAFSGLDVATIAAQFATAGGRPPQAIPGRLEATAEGFTMSGGGRQLGGADSLRIESETDRQLAGSGRAALRGIRLDGIPQLQAFLTQLGYQALVGDITMEAGFQPQGGRLTMPSFVIAAPGYGTITLALDVDGLDRDAAPEAMAARMRLLGLTLRFRDEGLLPRALRMQAAQQQINEGQLREQIIGMLNAAIGGPAGAALRAPIERFVRGQAQELEIAARPPQPLPVMSLSAQPPRDAADAQRRFGLTATAR
jgi:hypothetical protein